MNSYILNKAYLMFKLRHSKVNNYVMQYSHFTFICADYFTEKKEHTTLSPQKNCYSAHSKKVTCATYNQYCIASPCN